MPEINSFGDGTEPITCHSWNSKRSNIALSLNNSDVQILEKAGKDWNELYRLTEHQQRVTSIDWAPNSNRIVTCGADRNAYVWVLEGAQWRPTLVILRNNRAATCVKWSPSEEKFACGSGAKVIAVCYFEKEHNWWVSKHIKKPLKSTVSSIDWHPNDVLLACGSSDFRARVFSAYVKEIQKKPSATPWGEKMPFGNLMADFSSGGGGWVHSVCFSKSGNQLAWVGHDSSVSVVDATNNMALQTLKLDHLPFVSCMWVSESSLVCAGHDCTPQLYTYAQGKLTHRGQCESARDQNADEKKKIGSQWRDFDRTGQEGGVTQLKTIHQNTITQISIFNGDKGRATKFATSGIDGQLVVWDTKEIEREVEGLTFL